MGNVFPDFGKYDNPILFWKADYAHHIATCPPGFADLPTAMGFPLYIRIDSFLGSSKLALGVTSTVHSALQWPALNAYFSADEVFQNKKSSKCLENVRLASFLS